MKKIILSFCSILVVSIGLAQQPAAKEMTLEQCLAYALGNSEAIMISQLSIKKADADVREIISYGLPRADLQGGLNYNYKVQTSLVDASNFDPSLPEGTLTEIQFGLPYDGRVNFGINQLIFDGSYFVGIEAAKTFRELSRKENQRTEINVIEAVSKAYYTVLISETQVFLLNENFNRLDTLLRETQQMYQNGFAEQIDIDRIRVSYNNVKVSLETQVQLLEISRKLLNFQMGLDLNQNMLLITQLTDVNLAVPEIEASFDYNDRIEYSQVQTNQHLARLDKKNYQSGYLPKIYAGFNYGYNSARSDASLLFSEKWYDFGSLGATLSIPIFDGFYKRSKIQQIQINIEQLDFQKSSLEKSIDIEIQQARINLQSNLNVLDIQKENQALAENIFRISKIKFQQGVGSNLELTNADNELKTAQSNYLAALYQSILSKIDLLKATGILQTSK